MLFFCFFIMVSLWVDSLVARVLSRKTQKWSDKAFSIAEMLKIFKHLRIITSRVSPWLCAFFFLHGRSERSCESITLRFACLSWGLSAWMMKSPTIINLSQLINITEKKLLKSLRNFALSFGNLYEVKNKALLGFFIWRDRQRKKKHMRKIWPVVVPLKHFLFELWISGAPSVLTWVCSLIEILLSQCGTLGRGQGLFRFAVPPYSFDFKFDGLKSKLGILFYNLRWLYIYSKLQSCPLWCLPLSSWCCSLMLSCKPQTP